MNYNGLDRRNREDITFHFDRTTKKFSYDAPLGAKSSSAISTARRRQKRGST